MPSVSVEIEVWCSCGEGLCNQSYESSKGAGVVVDPCQKCLNISNEEGYNEGYDRGYEDGEKDG